MPQLFDLSVARTILQSDPVWCTYALGDLEPALAAKCSWFWNYSDMRALVLIYRGFSPPILFVTGQPELVTPLLPEIAAEPVVSLHVQSEIMPLLATRYDIVGEKSDWRMALSRGDFRPASVRNAVLLGPADVDRVQSLYSDGEATGESPEYFAAESLVHGVFYGVPEGDELTAVAGTHLVSGQEQVAALGNVYTRRDRRGLGLAAQTTSAVAKDLAGRGIRTIALNVRQQNEQAIRVYERLGFRKHCEFRDGIASRR